MYLSKYEHVLTKNKFAGTTAFISQITWQLYPISKIMIRLTWKKISRLLTLTFGDGNPPVIIDPSHMRLGIKCSFMSWGRYVMRAHEVARPSGIKRMTWISNISHCNSHGFSTCSQIQTTQTGFLLLAIGIDERCGLFFSILLITSLF